MKKSRAIRKAEESKKRVTLARLLEVTHMANSVLRLTSLLENLKVISNYRNMCCFTQTKGFMERMGKV